MLFKPKISLILLLSTLFLYGNCHKDFAWGVATAAFQIEGAWNESGKGMSIWDTFSHIPGRIHQNQTGEVSDDFYHRYPEDIAIMKQLGIKHFRMSISWSRVLPKGTVNLHTKEGINQAGVDFYLRLFDALLEAGIEPWVTLYHWDLPQALDDKTDNGGWLNPDIVHRFHDYAEFCFQTFGHKVKRWLTMNEILTYAVSGYASVGHAPGRCDSDPLCKTVGGGGNNGREPYLVAHHSLIGHALAVRTYRAKYQKEQGGQIGIPLNVECGTPLTNKQEDIDAVERYHIWQFGWLYDPIVFGDYPEVMKKLIDHDRLPKFNETMRELMKGSFDFIGFNHYKCLSVNNNPVQGTFYDNDGQYQLTNNRIEPEGLRIILNWIKNRYGNHPMYIFENGMGIIEDDKEKACNDQPRIEYMKGYLGELHKAMTIDGIDVRGYFHWSLMDNYEWALGYLIRYGIVYTDYKDLKRYPKESGKWYANMIKNWEAAYGDKNLRGVPTFENLISE